jgi:asparagine synthase (glutamine-hydrolysing)
MQSASGRFVLVFNGEIYNFRDLRRELSSQGARFRGSSDTEVLLAGFEAWGIPETVRRAHGMFALGVWDRHTLRLSLSRDRLGEKPLYVSWGPNGLRFGSELKTLLAVPGHSREIDAAAVWHLLRCGYIPAPHTIWEGISKVLPGQLLTFGNPSGAPEQERYWDPAVVLSARRASGFTGSAHEATQALEALLRRVISQEMVADVPIGAFLSGGTDSSLVTALMQAESERRIRTFTIGFHDEQFNEAPFAQAVAKHLGTEHTEVMLAPDEALQFVDALPDIYDEPFADSSQLPTLLVSHTTRQHVTVALSGDGGDELFSGYTQYRPGRDSVGRILSKLPPVSRPLLRGGLAALPRPVRYGVLSRLRSNPTTEPVERLDDRIRLALTGRSEQQRYEDALAIWPDPDHVLAKPQRSQERAGTWLPMDDYASPRMLWDTQTYLPDDICVKVDRAAMHASLEVRAPLLHHEVAEFAWSLPRPYLRDGDEGKRILKAVLARHVPTELTERTKRGFAVPLDRWLRSALRPWGEDLLSSAKDWPFRPDVVRGLWRAHLEERGNHGRQLWPVLVFLAWQRRWAP